MTLRRATPTLSTFFFLLLVAGCAAESREWLDDSTRLETDAPLGAADSAASTATYYVARPDFRRCAWPNCGGMWVRRPNRTTTRCADGHYASECYVTEVDATAIGLSPDEATTLASAFSRDGAVIEGTIGHASTGSLTYSVLRAQRGWIAANDGVADGVFYRLEDNGIRCVRAPCFSIHEQKLNSSLDRMISDIDFDAVGLTGSQRNVGPALAGQGLLAAGTNARDRHTGAMTLVATQVFFPALPAPTTCTTDADCTLTFYTSPVGSEADCYCPGCPSPALASTATANQASWQLYCAATHGIDVCPARPCAPPPPAGCMSGGVCGFGRPAL